MTLPERGPEPHEIHAFLAEGTSTTPTKFVEKLADKLTMIGLEVESLEDKAKLSAPFTIARVISAEQHPNADRLRVCMVDPGDEPTVQVVCGAPNARAGLVSVFSPPGTFIAGPGHVALGVGAAPGVESRGMLCSPPSCRVPTMSGASMELPADAPVGKGYVEWAALGDPVFEIDRRPEQFTGVHGIARDLSAADMGEFGIPPSSGSRVSFRAP